MARSVFGDLLGFLAYIKAGCAVGAPEPDAADLVRVDVAQRLAVEDVSEVGRRVLRVENGACWDLAHSRSVQWRQQGLGRGESEVNGTVELEEDVARIVYTVRPELAQGALRGVSVRQE